MVPPAPDAWTPCAVAFPFKPSASRTLGIGPDPFAVDWPFVANTPAVQWMETVPLYDEDKAKILSVNAQRLLRL
jgi:hypothetical protein